MSKSFIIKHIKRGPDIMRTIKTTSEGATIELTSAELSLLALIGVEVFGGSFNVTDDQWQAVMMPASRDEAERLMLDFVGLHATTKKM
jgi:hypothetical protein